MSRPKKMQELQVRFEAELKKLRAGENEMQLCVSKSQQLEAQLAENQAVASELAGLAESAVVFKLLGPVLIRQTPEDSRVNVDKRLKFIRGEIERNDTNVEVLSRKIKSYRETLERIRERFQPYMKHL